MNYRGRSTIKEIEGTDVYIDIKACGTLYSFKNLIFTTILKMEYL